MPEPDSDTGDAEANATKQLHLASWSDRFWAWLIDVLLVGAALSAIGDAAGVFPVLTGDFPVTTPFLGANGFGLWLYWTFLEGSRGQSAGKTVMDITVTDEHGDPITFVEAAVESFGKAFVLPLDLLIGWFAMSGEYVRLFNRLSSTIVVRTPTDERVPEGVEYVPPED